MSDRTDFAPMGEMEISSAGDIFEGCEFIRATASSSGLIVMQWAQDVEWALSTVMLPDQNWADNPARRARRVTRHAYRAAEALQTTAKSAAKLPQAYLKAYADVIKTRKSSRPRFDPKAGL